MMSQLLPPFICGLRHNTTRNVDEMPGSRSSRFATRLPHYAEAFPDGRGMIHGDLNEVVAVRQLVLLNDEILVTGYGDMVRNRH